MENPKKITTIGGQALMEGIMMVGPKRTVAAFCDEEGNISTEEISVPRLTKQYPLLGKPFIRGIFALADSFRMGYKALSLSADKLTEGDEEEELTGLDKWLNDHLGEKITGVIMAVASVLGIALAVVLFFMLPTVLFNLLENAVPADIAGWRSIFEGVLRIGLFVGYVALIALVPDIKRTFQYHGAEHKTIFCYEADLPLTVENVRKQRRFHPRCGTSFMILMLVIGIIVGFFIPFSNPFLRTFTKLLCIPVIMNIGYEVQRGAKGLRPPRQLVHPGRGGPRPVDAAPDREGARRQDDRGRHHRHGGCHPRKRRGLAAVTCRQLYLEARRRLSQAGIDSPGVDAALLSQRFLGLDRPGLALHGEEEPAPDCNTF